MPNRNPAFFKLTARQCGVDPLGQLEPWGCEVEPVHDLVVLVVRQLVAQSPQGTFSEFALRFGATRSFPGSSGS